MAGNHRPNGQLPDNHEGNRIWDAGGNMLNARGDQSNSSYDDALQSNQIDSTTESVNGEDARANPILGNRADANNAGPGAAEELPALQNNQPERFIVDQRVLIRRDQYIRLRIFASRYRQPALNDPNARLLERLPHELHDEELAEQQPAADEHIENASGSENDNVPPSPDHSVPDTDSPAHSPRHDRNSADDTTSELSNESASNRSHRSRRERHSGSEHSPESDHNINNDEAEAGGRGSVASDARRSGSEYSNRSGSASSRRSGSRNSRRSGSGNSHRSGSPNSRRSRSRNSHRSGSGNSHRSGSVNSRRSRNSDRSGSGNSHRSGSGNSRRSGSTNSRRSGSRNSRRSGSGNSHRTGSSNSRRSGSINSRRSGSGNSHRSGSPNSRRSRSRNSHRSGSGNSHRSGSVNSRRSRNSDRSGSGNSLRSSSKNSHRSVSRNSRRSGSANSRRSASPISQRSTNSHQSASRNSHISGAANTRRSWSPSSQRSANSHRSVSRNSHRSESANSRRSGSPTSQRSTNSHRSVSRNSHRPGSANSRRSGSPTSQRSGSANSHRSGSVNRHTPDAASIRKSSTIYSLSSTSKHSHRSGSQRGRSHRSGSEINEEPNSDHSHRSRSVHSSRSAAENSHRSNSAQSFRSNSRYSHALGSAQSDRSQQRGGSNRESEGNSPRGNDGQISEAESRISDNSERKCTTHDDASGISGRRNDRSREHSERSLSRDDWNNDSHYPNNQQQQSGYRNGESNSRETTRSLHTNCEPASEVAFQQSDHGERERHTSDDNSKDNYRTGNGSFHSGTRSVSREQGSDVIVISDDMEEIEPLRTYDKATQTKFRKGRRNRTKDKTESPNPNNGSWYSSEDESLQSNLKDEIASVVRNDARKGKEKGNVRRSISETKSRSKSNIPSNSENNNQLLTNRSGSESQLQRSTYYEEKNQNDSNEDHSTEENRIQNDNQVGDQTNESKREAPNSGKPKDDKSHSNEYTQQECCSRCISCSNCSRRANANERLSKSYKHSRQINNRTTYVSSECSGGISRNILPSEHQSTRTSRKGRVVANYWNNEVQTNGSDGDRLYSKPSHNTTFDGDIESPSDSNRNDEKINEQKKNASTRANQCTDSGQNRRPQALRVSCENTDTTGAVEIQAEGVCTIWTGRDPRKRPITKWDDSYLADNEQSNDDCLSESGHKTNNLLEEENVQLSDSSTIRSRRINSRKVIKKRSCSASRQIDTYGANTAKFSSDHDNSTEQCTSEAVQHSQNTGPQNQQPGPVNDPLSREDKHQQQKESSDVSGENRFFFVRNRQGAPRRSPSQQRTPAEIIEYGKNRKYTRRKRRDHHYSSKSKRSRMQESTYHLRKITFNESRSESIPQKQASTSRIRPFDSTAVKRSNRKRSKCELNSGTKRRRVCAEVQEDQRGDERSSVDRNSSYKRQRMDSQRAEKSRYTNRSRKNDSKPTNRHWSSDEISRAGSSQKPANEQGMKPQHSRTCGGCCNSRSEEDSPNEPRSRQRPPRTRAGEKDDDSTTENAQYVHGDDHQQSLNQAFHDGVSITERQSHRTSRSCSPNFEYLRK